MMLCSRSSRTWSEPRRAAKSSRSSGSWICGDLGSAEHQVVAPGGGVQDGRHAVGDAEFGAHPGPHLVAVRPAEDVVARVAGLADRPPVAEGVAEPLGAVRVGREQDVPAGDVPVGLEQPPLRGVRDVVVDPLQRGAVPGLQVGGAGLLGPVQGDAVVADHQVGGLERGHRLGRAEQDGLDAGREGVLRLGRADPAVPVHRPAAGEQLVVDRAGVVGEQSAVDEPGDVHGRVRGRPRPRRGVERRSWTCVIASPFSPWWSVLVSGQVSSRPSRGPVRLWCSTRVRRSPRNGPAPGRSRDRPVGVACS